MPNKSQDFNLTSVVFLYFDTKQSETESCLKLCKYTECDPQSCNSSHFKIITRFKIKRIMQYN